MIEAADGESALAYARKLRPDAIVTEVALPRLDGFGLLQDLRVDGNAAAVFIYTEQTDSAYCPGASSWELSKRARPRRT